VLGVLVLSVCGLLVLAGCGDQYATLRPDNPTHLADGLVFTRADGSSYEVDGAVAARCTTSPVTGTEYVNLTDPESGFLLEVVAGVTGTRELPLHDKLLAPTRKDGTGPADLLVLARDPASGARLTGFGQRARGTVTVTEAACDPQPRVTFRISAQLADPDGRPVKVAGGLATVS
jgi:hypothetical protein